MRVELRLSLLVAALIFASSAATAEPMPLETDLYHHELGQRDAEVMASGDLEGLVGLTAMYLWSGRPLDAARVARIAERVVERGIAMSRASGSSAQDIAEQQEELVQIKRLIANAEAGLGKTEAAYDGNLANAVDAALGDRNPDDRINSSYDVASIALVAGDFTVARDFAKAGLDEIERRNPKSAFNSYPEDTPEEAAATRQCEELGEDVPARSGEGIISAGKTPAMDCEEVGRASFARLFHRMVHYKLAGIYADAMLAINPGRAAFAVLVREIQINALYRTSNAAALLKLGYLLKSLGDNGAAEVNFASARKQAKTDIGLAPFDSYNGQVSPAAEVLGAASQSGAVSTALLLAGETELAAGRPEVALTFIDAAEAGIQATIASSGLTGARTRYLAGLAKLRLGRNDQAVADLSAASELYDSYMPSSRDLRRLASGRFDTAIDVHLALLEAALAVGDDDLAGAAAARAARAGIARSSGAALVRLQSGSSSAAVRAAQDAARSASAAEDQLTALIAAGKPAGAIKPAAENVAVARARARESLDAVLAERPELRLFGVGSAATGAQLRERLEPGEAILMLAIGRDRGYAVAVTPLGLTAKPIQASRARIQQLVTQIVESCQFQRRGDHYATRPFARAQSAELFRLLLGPLTPVLAGTSRIYLARNGVLDSLSFNTLYDDENHRWFGDRFAFSVVPDPSRVGLPSSRRSAGTAGVLGVGDPVIHESARLRDLMAPARPDQAPVRRDLAPPQQQLAGARQELAAVLDAWPSPRSRVLVGRQATEQSFRRAATGNFKILAFATHAMTANPKFRQPSPALVFTKGPRGAGPADDGYLHPSEIENLSLKSDLVLLSACETAAGNGPPNAEALSGLAQAFLYAGARSVAATHWKVDSASAAALVSRAMASLSARPASTAAAFRAAAIEVRALPGKSHPAFWAPFVVVETGER